MNLFEYVEDNPLNRTDPTGLLPCNAFQSMACDAECDAYCAKSGTFVDKATCTAWEKETTIGGVIVVTLGHFCDCTCKPKPKQTCTDAVKAALQAAVVAACKGPNSGRRCIPGMSRKEALENAAKFDACAAARDAINTKCFAGGDRGHQKAADDAPGSTPLQGRRGSS